MENGNFSDSLTVFQRNKRLFSLFLKPFSLFIFSFFQASFQTEGFRRVLLVKPFGNILATIRPFISER